jgi:hypothetical protein
MSAMVRRARSKRKGRSRMTVVHDPHHRAGPGEP